MTTASKLGLLCGLGSSEGVEKAAIMRTALRAGARLVGKKGLGKGLSKGLGKAKGKIKGKGKPKGKKGKGKPAPKAVEAPEHRVGADYPAKIELPSGIPEGGPTVPGLAESLGHSISNMSYELSPEIQKLLVRLAGGPTNPRTARTLGFMAPAAALGTAYGLSNVPEPKPATPASLRAALLSGYVPPTFGN